AGAAPVLEGDSRLTNARTPTAHNHPISDVTGLQNALDGKQASGSYAAASHDHDSLYRRPVVHGDNASMARPAGAAFVEWIGSVEPTNAENADTWLNTAEA